MVINVQEIRSQQGFPPCQRETQHAGICGLIDNSADGLKTQFSSTGTLIASLLAAVAVHATQVAAMCNFQAPAKGPRPLPQTLTKLLKTQRWQVDAIHFTLPLSRQLTLAAR